MTVTTTEFFTDWLVADGANKNWGYDFTVTSADTILVEVRQGLNGEIVRLDSNFLWEPVDQSTGFVVYPAEGAPLAVGYYVRLVRNMPYVQPIEIGNEGPFHPELHETAFDNLTMQMQQVADGVSRAVKVPLGSPVDTDKLTQYLTAVGENIGEVVTVADNIDPITVVEDNIEAINTAASNMPAIIAAPTAAAEAVAARDAALGAVPNAFVSTRAALAALDTNTITAAFLKEPGREGQFFWRSGDYSSEVAIDTAEGVYIKADAVSASTGAWVRVFDGFTFDVLWFGAVVYSSVSGDMNANVTALSIIHALAQSRATVILPFGLLNINQTIEITKPISFIGKTKLGSGFYAVGFNQDISILDYQGTAIAPIQNIELRDFGLWSDNNLARGMTLTWVNKSTVDNLYLYDLYRGVYGDYAWSDSWKNISTYNITRETFLFGDECNNSNFDRVEFSGSSGLKITGHCAGFTFTGCDFENITDENGAALELVPTSGKFISGVSLSGCYFERIKGVGIRCAGADARSVRGLSVQGCSIYGGSTDFFSGTAGQAEYGIVLHNISGFMITGNTFDDWRSTCIFRDDTERDGRVENNTISRTSDLTNSAGAIHGSVVVRNNFSTTNGVYLGRREEWENSVPTSGTYRKGDVVWVRGAPTIDANNLVLLGWARMTSGSGHAVGTDWARLYASHVSPAT